MVFTPLITKRVENKQNKNCLIFLLVTIYTVGAIIDLSPERDVDVLIVEIYTYLDQCTCICLMTLMFSYMWCHMLLHVYVHDALIPVLLETTSDGHVVECLSGVQEVVGSIPGRVIPQTLKMLLGSSLLGICKGQTK